MKTNYLLKILLVISWIIFIGLCIEAGGFIVNAVATLAWSGATAGKFWLEANLSDVYQHNDRDFITIVSMMIIVAVLRAILFYHIVKMLTEKRISFSAPFNIKVNKFLKLIAYISFAIGIFSVAGVTYAEGLVKQGINIPSIQHLRLAGGDVWIFMGVILLVIGQMFKKGISIQSENDLTI